MFAQEPNISPFASAFVPMPINPYAQNLPQAQAIGAPWIPTPINPYAQNLPQAQAIGAPWIPTPINPYVQNLLQAQAIGTPWIPSQPVHAASPFVPTFGMPATVPAIAPQNPFIIGNIPVGVPPIYGQIHPSGFLPGSIPVPVSMLPGQPLMQPGFPGFTPMGLATQPPTFGYSQVTPFGRI